MINRKNQTEDEYYVKMAQQGDRDALEFLFQKYHNLAFYIALRICHCDADAEDIVQESFIEINRSIHKLQEPKYFKAWLNKVIFSKCTKLFRKNKDVLMSERDDLLMAENQEERRYLLPKEHMKFESDREVLLSLIDQLPDKLKITLDLMFFQQLSVKEIAMILEIPEGTVKSRIAGAKSQLKVLISEYEHREQVKLDFQASSLEAAIAVALGRDFLSHQSAEHAARAFQGVRRFLHSVPPMTLAMVLSSSIATASFSFGIMALISSDKEADVKVADTLQYRFEPVAFQGKLLMNAREAYETLINHSHCYVEVQEADPELQDELKRIYFALKNHGGTYYDLLAQRKFALVFE